jgi:penicillin-binding protein 1A
MASVKRPPSKQLPKKPVNKRKPKKTAKKKPKKAGFGKRLIIGALWLSFFAAMLGIVLLFGAYLYIGSNLPDHRNYSFIETSKIYSTDGVKIGELFQTDPTVRRTVVPIGELPIFVVDAVLAAEDGGFYQHKGLDYFGMFRAFYKMVTRGKISGGGSTITQQTVKNMLLTHEKKFERKFKELILARRLESSLTKDEILNIYLNIIYLGHGRNGIEEAAQFYFGVPASKLSLSQATTIAGLIQSPENLSPRKHPKSSKRRQIYVLDQMVKKGFLGKEEAQTIKKAPLPKLAPPPRIATAYRWFTDVAVKQLSKEYSLEDLQTGGYTIHTTLDSKWQLAAHAAVQEKLNTSPGSITRGFKSGLNVEKWIKKRSKKLGRKALSLGVPLQGVVLKRTKKEGITVSVGKGTGRLNTKSVKRIEEIVGRKLKRGDLVRIIVEKPPTETDLGTFRLPSSPEVGFAALDPHTGDVRALIGGYDWRQSKFNRATQMKRQIGSTFKPFVYGAAFASRQYTLSTMLNDSPETIHLGRGKYYKPKNYSGKYSGNVTVRRALAKSINTTAIRTTLDIGTSAVTKFAKRCGLPGTFPNGPALALGVVESSPLALARSYGPFATDGKLARSRFVTSVSKGTSTLQRFEPRVEQVIPAGIAFLIQEGLVGVVKNGTARKLRDLPETIGGKTGTTNDNRDAWFVGITPRMVSAVWVGRDNNKSLWKKATGGSVGAPIFKRFIETIEPGALEFPPAPESIVVLNINEDGYQVRPVNPQEVQQSTRGKPEYFLKGTEPDIAPEKLEKVEALWELDEPVIDPIIPKNGAPQTLPLFETAPPPAVNRPAASKKPDVLPLFDLVQPKQEPDKRKNDIKSVPAQTKTRQLLDEDAFE